MTHAGERENASLPQLKMLWQRRRDLDRVVDPAEGLRERKKRRTRQQISDTATGMFLELGFDDVRVADVAEACGVSEKTVYNYFPTKESLLFDREPEMIAAVRRALGPGAPSGSPVTAFADELAQEVEWMAQVWSDFPDGVSAQYVLRRFHELVSETPSLRAAYRDMHDRIAQVAAEELAERAGVDPMDPEPQVAAAAICSLRGVMFRALEKHVDDQATAAEVGAAAVEELHRAARLIDTGLWSFGLEVQGTTSALHIKQTAEAANEARKQVMVAVKAAKAAWVSVAEEAMAHRASDRSGGRSGGSRRGDDRSTVGQQVRAARDEARQAQREVKKAKQNVKRAAAELRSAKQSATRRPS